eukprot:scaffold2926_cov247-Pinguiococcus_pyrenoidosus.AAC.4
MALSGLPSARISRSTCSTCAISGLLMRDGSAAASCTMSWSVVASSTVAFHFLLSSALPAPRLLGACERFSWSFSLPLPSRSSSSSAESSSEAASCRARFRRWS